MPSPKDFYEQARKAKAPHKTLEWLRASKNWAMFLSDDDARERIGWCFEHLTLPSQAVSVWKNYEAIEIPAWNAYKDIEGPAWKASQEASRKANWHQTREANQTYVAIEKAAKKAYEAKRRPAWENCKARLISILGG
jgi:hypothetical protein